MRNLPGLTLVFALSLFGQKGNGELHLLITDPTGRPLEASLAITGQATAIRQNLAANANGEATIKPLPFGFYQIIASHPGFQPYRETVEVRTEVPAELRLRMGVAAVETTLVVKESETLVDPHRTATVYFIGQQKLSEARAAQMSRGVPDTVNQQPGWLMEAGGVLHPRGSEYNTQYVIDGIPIADNRSPTFAPGLELQDLGSMNVLTAGYPAEYGRKLGGVVEVTSRNDAPAGFHGALGVDAGSFRSQSGSLSAQQRWQKTTATISGTAGSTRRFLDPPAEENYTNKASGGGLTGRVEHDLTSTDRLSIYLHSKRSGFLVPNEPEQEEAGQRQDRNTSETMGQFSYQRTLSPALLASFRAMVRDLSANLWSNPQSTPVEAFGVRGFREGYTAASLSWQRGRHSIKTGAEFIAANLYESFSYHLTVPDAIDGDYPRRFAFADQGKSREAALFIQDLIRAGRFTISAGLRFDRYSLRVRENAFSPRLGLAYQVPGWGLRLHGSYDRAFETPAMEGLLVASSPLMRRITSESTGLPVRPTRSHFFQTGFAKSLWGRMRLDANYFVRRSRNFGDDGVLLNTGVSFPINFDRAEIHGAEAKLELPSWGRWSGFLSYSNMTGTGFLPLTGGLFLERNAGELLRSNASFPITQDQRNTVRGQIRRQLTPRLWTSWGGSYNSGLPFEAEGGLEEDDLGHRFSRRILNQVNFDRGRLRPQFSMDASAGVTLLQGEEGNVYLQASFWNLTNNLNVINFSGLFSGTAIGVPRSGSIAHSN